MQPNNIEHFKNWLPIKLYCEKGELKLDWICMHDVPFIHPFFDETIGQFKMKNWNQPKQLDKLTTSLDEIFHIAETFDSVPLSLLIFHTSRCGSTLTTQALSLNSSFIVVSEYLIIDQILRIKELNETISDEYQDELIKAIFKIIGQKRFLEQEQLMIKLDSWHFTFYDRLVRLFPNSKQVILFRDPDAIKSSIDKKPGMQFVPSIVSPQYFDISSELAFENYPQAYIDLILQQMYISIQNIIHSNTNILLLDYNLGIQSNIKKLFELIDFAPDQFLQKEIHKRLMRNAKYPDQTFIQPDPIIDPNITNKTRNIYRHLAKLAEDKA